MRGLVAALKGHWPEYLMEGACLGAFMISAGAFACLVFHPASPLRLAPGLGQRFLMGLAMATTLVAIVYSAWGRRSGAHINPAVTLSFWRLGKISGPDALFYVLAQFAGAVAGISLLGVFLARPLGDASVRWVSTLPGPYARATVFASETAISFAMMLTVLLVSNTPGLSRYTGLFAATLLALFITFESPVSGTSMNPARSFGSATGSRIWEAFWIYAAAPPLAMLAAAETYVRAAGAGRVHCAKLHHDDHSRCIFRCGYPMLGGCPSLDSDRLLSGRRS